MGEGEDHAANNKWSTRRSKISISWRTVLTALIKQIFVARSQCLVPALINPGGTRSNQWIEYRKRGTVVTVPGNRPRRHCCSTSWHGKSHSVQTWACFELERCHLGATCRLSCPFVQKDGLEEGSSVRLHFKGLFQQHSTLFCEFYRELLMRDMRLLCSGGVYDDNCCNILISEALLTVVKEDILWPDNDKNAS